jgi:hypothetical protein
VIRFLVDEAAREAIRQSRDISRESFARAMTRVPQSCGPKTEERYRQIEERASK